MAEPNLIGESQERAKRFERELASVDPATRFHLLGAWKEQIISDCVSALRATDDPKLISHIDGAIAMVLDLVAWREISSGPAQ
ncbi:MAG: hypothetical protein Q8S00_01830 [Deltaproteobacteria bacterium]|nr:hypothetical protein [Deltaproteobacteria bacterium]